MRGFQLEEIKHEEDLPKTPGFLGGSFWYSVMKILVALSCSLSQRLFRLFRENNCVNRIIENKRMVIRESLKISCSIPKQQIDPNEQ